MKIDTSDIEITTEDLAALKGALLAARDVVSSGEPYGPNATDQELAERLRDALRIAMQSDPIVNTMVAAALWCEHWGSANQANAFEDLRYAIHRMETQ